jgi:hypothetical protein
MAVEEKERSWETSFKARVEKKNSMLEAQREAEHHKTACTLDEDISKEWRGKSAAWDRKMKLCIAGIVRRLRSAQSGKWAPDGDKVW